MQMNTIAKFQIVRVAKGYSDKFPNQKISDCELGVVELAEEDQPVKVKFFNIDTEAFRTVYIPASFLIVVGSKEYCI